MSELDKLRNNLFNNLQYIEKLENENKQLKELKYKFFDNCGDEESFTLEDYLEIGNKLYDYEEENKKLKEERKEILELIKNRNTTKSKKERFISGKSTLDRISEILGDEE